MAIASSSNVAVTNAKKQNRMTNPVPRRIPPDANAYGKVKTPVPSMKLQKNANATYGL